MIAKLKQLLASERQAISPQEKAKHLNLAAVSLLLEVVYADETLSDEELHLLPSLLTTTLSLAPGEVDELIATAQANHKDATSLYEFTTEINQQFSLAEKQQLILAMWKLAYADGHLCRYEDQIVRRTADLLHLKHSELIQMRNAAINQLP
ncbi:TerB family tellurite resistance protein [Shewanella algidipiscicola]|uniref:Tellurium resistance terB-like protein subgroup 2 n=1 Tax=Shewanella algidipiscicola TaxID=614070 RepID=A0ABQ4PLW7_9GAMM|nr:TerB family tellurite resistance protein [Shewanella algidipiscicola]GIU49039.1 tellurium resistance terB-like protein subgroup 2 [Shewanella algidipiscicola]